MARIVNGGTPDTKNRDYWEGGDICWATLVDTREKYLNDTARKITPAGLKHTNLLPIDAVIFSSRATIGQVCIAKVPTSTNQGFKSFVCDTTKLDFEYLYYLLQFLKPVFEGLIPRSSKYKEINASAVQAFQIPVPPLSRQKEIARECREIDGAATKILEGGVALKDVDSEIGKRKHDVIAKVVKVGTK